MNELNEISVELQQISPFLASMEKVNVFTVPEGYFIGLAEKITVYSFMNVGKSDQRHAGPQEIPTGYFDNLSSQILNRIKAETQNDEEELQQISPVLYSLKGKNPFTVPEDYFEKLSGKVMRKLKPEPAKIIPFNKVKAYWRYAAAAVITGGIAVSSLQIFNSSPDMRKSNSVVTESSGLPPYMQSAMQYKTAEQVQQGISSLSDDEIAKYLEKHGNMLDNDALVKDINTKSLPAATDYLTDDDALDNYLNTIDQATIQKPINMKKYLLILLAFIGSFTVAMAQDPTGSHAEKVQALKIAFITQKLQLTSAEAEKFWPVYNQYENEIKALRADKKNADVLDNEEKLLNIRKKYKPSFEKILGPAKLNELYTAEKEFRNVLIKQLKNRNQ